MMPLFSHRFDSVPTNWKDYAKKWGLPWVSLTGRIFAAFGVLTLPVADCLGHSRASLLVAGVGMAMIGGSVFAATVVKVAGVARTACFVGWTEAKKKIDSFKHPEGLICNTIFPDFSQMMKEGIEMVRKPLREQEEGFVIV